MRNMLKDRTVGLPPSTDCRRPITGKGFTLIEVLIAMGIFLGAMLAILGIYFQNLRLARMAREEIIVSMIQRDIMARNQVVASARAGQERASCGAGPTSRARIRIRSRGSASRGWKSSRRCGVKPDSESSRR